MSLSLNRTVVCDILGIRAIYVGLITDFVGEEEWESKYWGVENEADAKIVESIMELCTEIRWRSRERK